MESGCGKRVGWTAIVEVVAQTPGVASTLASGDQAIASKNYL
jgi:hypothetical protein